MIQIKVRRVSEGRPKMDKDLRLKGWRMGKRVSQLVQSCELWELRDENT